MAPPILVSLEITQPGLDITKSQHGAYCWVRCGDEIFSACKYRGYIIHQWAPQCFRARRDHVLLGIIVARPIHYSCLYYSYGAKALED